MNKTLILKLLFAFLFFSGLFLMSCGHTYTLSEEDLLWMPYKGNETLVFKSNTGATDTIFLLKKDTMLAYPEAQSMNGTKHEVVSVFCKHSDSNMPINEHRYLENTFFRLEKAIDNRGEIVINLSAKDAEFYRHSSIKTDSLNKERQISLQTIFGLYTDVYVINAEDYTGSFHQRSNFITKIYWSKSNGLIRYDKKDDVYWELEKKY